jgi:hypothetical protein
MKPYRLASIVVGVCLLTALAAATSQAQVVQPVPSQALITGEIIQLMIDDPGDAWSGGTIVVDGQNVILPRNLIILLPGRWSTLTQIFAEAPAVCVARGESGLARNDTCRDGESGGFATLHANRTGGGNLIVGEAFIEKGVEIAAGVVTYIDYTDGYFRIGGEPGDPDTGVMVRINDPNSRWTIQQGLGCAGGPNCSPDPRFTGDDVNYTITHSTGYPACIPSTVTGGNRTSGSDANGNGDAFCPSTNRTVNNGRPVVDSSRFAPILLGDHVFSAEGNYETVDGVRFLSVHTILVNAGLTTSPGQPDYMTFDEAFWDVAAFFNERIRVQWIMFTTDPTSQLDIYARHFDRFTNQAFEYPVGSTFNNPDTINQGLPPNPGGIARIRYDVDFIVGAKVGLSPCRNLNNAGFAVCSSVPSLAEEFSVVVPVAREVVARTRNKAANPGLQAFDINGLETSWGEYVTPMDLDFQEFQEIDLGRLNTPFTFSGVPWNLDRRLSPDGCVAAGCESLPQPLDPFPFSQLDPRTQSGIPSGVEDEIFAFHPFGDTDFLAWPPADPPGVPIDVTPDPIDPCDGANRTPIAGADSATTLVDQAVVIDVVANDSDVDGFIDPATVVIVDPATSGTAVPNGDGTVTYTPNTGFTGADSFTYTVADNLGAVSNVQVVRLTVEFPNQPPVAVNDTATTDEDVALSIAVLANDTDADGLVDPGTVTIVTPAGNGSAVPNINGTVFYTPNSGFSGLDSFAYTVADDDGAVSNAATVLVTVVAAPPPDMLTVTLAHFQAGPSRWQVAGTAVITTNNQVTIYNGPTVGGGLIIGVATVQPDGTWSYDERNHPVQPDPTNTISVASSAGAILEAVPIE